MHTSLIVCIHKGRYRYKQVKRHVQAVSKFRVALKMYKIDIELCYKTLMEVITAAAKIVKEGFEGSKTVTVKSPLNDVVTEYDKKTELLIIQSLAKVFPDHKFMGEETTENTKLTDEPTWIIDPIDGTNNFVHRFPHCAISIGLSVNKDIVLGAVCNPMMNQTFTAVKGRGAFLNGNKIYASKVEDMKDALIGFEISIGTHPAYREKWVKKYRSCISQTQGMRSLGSAELSLCLVAMGAWDAFHVEHLYPWDFAAGSIILTEAGGIIFDVDGGKFDVEKGRCIAAGTEKLAKSLVKVFKVE